MPACSRVSLMLIFPQAARCTSCGSRFSRQVQPATANGSSEHLAETRPNAVSGLTGLPCAALLTMRHHHSVTDDQSPGTGFCGRCGTLFDSVSCLSNGSHVLDRFPFGQKPKLRHYGKDARLLVGLSNPGFELLIHVPIRIGRCVNLNRESWHFGKRAVEAGHEFIFRLCVIGPFT